MSARLQESVWSEYKSPKYVLHTLCNLGKTLQIHSLPEKRFGIEVARKVLHLVLNVLDNPIEWSDSLTDPVFDSASQNNAKEWSFSGDATSTKQTGQKGTIHRKQDQKTIDSAPCRTALFFLSFGGDDKKPNN